MPRRAAVTRVFAHRSIATTAVGDKLRSPGVSERAVRPIVVAERATLAMVEAGARSSLIRFSIFVRPL